MPNIAIHRCTLHIVRHGGWSWGPEPRKLLQIAIKAFPELLARELGKLWADDAELEFAAPISLRIPLSMGDLLAATNEGSDLNSTQTSPLMQALGERIGLAARKAFVSEQPTAFVTSPNSETQPRVDQETYFAAEREAGSAVIETLYSWHREGVLSRRLAAFSLAALEAWLDRLVQDASYPGSRNQSGPLDRESVYHEVIESLSGDRPLSVTPEVIEGLVGDRALPVTPKVIEGFVGDRPLSVTPEVMERLVGDGALSVTPEVIETLIVDSLRPLQNTPYDREAILRRRLMVLTEVMIQLGLRQCTPILLAALERALPLSPGGQTEASNLDTNFLSGECEQKVSPMKTVEQLATATPMERADPESENQSEGRSAGPDGIRASSDWEQKSLQRNARDAPDTPLAAGERAVNETDSPPAEFPSRTSEPQFSSPTAKLTSKQSPRRTEIYSGLSQRQRPSLHLPSQGKTRQVASALPFLLLGPLSGLGYLGALAATMEAANTLAALPLFAAAFAYKVLAPPARGWRREPDSIAAATAFAGLNQPATEPALVQLAENLRHHLSPLDATLSGALISGHDQQQPLLLLRAGTTAESGLLLLDVDGMFPIQWAASASDLRQVLIQLDSSIVLIPRLSAEPHLLRWLNEEGFRFVTDAIPTRGEHWRALRRSLLERWWTNEAIMSDSAIIKVARTLSDAAEEAESFWQALIVQRPSIPLAGDASLDRHLTLAASVALGSVAWELWRDREPTTPYLALERFHDLEAKVTHMRDAVQVSLPLGKRFQDLRDHGLLNDVVDVPWFNGRPLRFSSN